MDKILYLSVVYFITNKEVSAIEKRIAAYYEHNFYVSCNVAENLFFEYPTLNVFPPKKAYLIYLPAMYFTINQHI